MIQTMYGTPQGKSVIEAILARRSVRAFAPHQLDRNTVQTLLEAAVRAPTAMHEEPWAFVVVQNQGLLKQLSERAKPIFIEEMRHHDNKGAPHSFEHCTRQDFDIFYGAGTLIIICAKPSNPFVTADCWLSAENMMLAACDMGLGSCIIGSSVSTLNISTVKTELGIPQEYVVVAPVIAGIPKEETPATLRKEPLILAWKH